MISVDRQVKVSQVNSQDSHPLNPYWGENYEFDILTGNEFLNLIIFCTNELGEKLNFGKCEIDIKTLLKD